MGEFVGVQHRPVPVRHGDDLFVPDAQRLGAEFASRTGEHDQTGAFVGENYRTLKRVGYLALAVPPGLGGQGASTRQICYAQAELARHCGSTALAVNMHLHSTLKLAQRWRQGCRLAGQLLRRVAEEGLVLVTSGGSDGASPSGLAFAEDGGFRVSGRKRFCSQAPVGGMLTTSAFTADHLEGPMVLDFTVPMSAPGVRVVETWDTLGMRGTGSHDVELDGVYIGSDQILGWRPWAKLSRSVLETLIFMSPTTAAVYYGIATSARDIAVLQAMGTNRGDKFLAELPDVRRQVGLMEFKLRTAWWSLLGALDQVGDGLKPEPGHVVTLALAKRCVVLHSVEVVDLAMEVVGGPSYFRRFPLEQAYRDVRAAKYHPFTPEATLFHAGQVAFGQAGEFEVEPVTGDESAHEDFPDTQTKEEKACQVATQL